MSVWYLESDDEITDAVARLRATEDERVVLVVPPGSRIATGRINFRLLAREATARKLALAVVSPDEQVRALAIAGGVVARSTVDEAEGALDRGEPAAPLVGPDPTSATDAAAEGEDSAATTDTEVPVPLARTTMAGSSRRRRVAATSVVAVGIALVGGYAGLRFLPTASITIDPDSVPLGPILVSVTASASVDGIDVTRGEIPADSIRIPLTVEARRDASGRETTESASRGEVVFSSGGLASPQGIAAGTRISTAEGVEFQTTQTVSLRPPGDDPGPAEVRVAVEAVLPGPEGNVDADTITETSLDEFGIAVTNPEPTAGGNRQEEPIITQSDYLAAAAEIENRLDGELARRLADPEIVPEGLTLFVDTADSGPVELRPPSEELVGTSAPQVELTGIATGTVLAVDESLVEEVAVARLAAAAPDGMALSPETVRVEKGTGTDRGDVVNYAARATGTAYATVDAPALIERIAGLPVAEARSILERYGTVTLSVWPDFLGALPEDGGRIDLVLGGPSAPDETDGG